MCSTEDVGGFTRGGQYHEEFLKVCGTFIWRTFRLLVLLYFFLPWQWGHDVWNPQKTTVCVFSVLISFTLNKDMYRERTIWSLHKILSLSLPFIWRYVCYLFPSLLIGRGSSHWATQAEACGVTTMMPRRPFVSYVEVHKTPMCVGLLKKENIITRHIWTFI